MLKQGPDFHFEKRLVEISEFEITKVDCISEITANATRTLGFLRRNLAFAPRHTKDAAYETLVQPKLE